LHACRWNKRLKQVKNDGYAQQSVPVDFGKVPFGREPAPADFFVTLSPLPGSQPGFCFPFFFFFPSSSSVFHRVSFSGMLAFLIVVGLCIQCTTTPVC
jgi:hypothetical protein